MNTPISDLELAAIEQIDAAISRNWNPNGYWHPHQPEVFIAAGIKPLLDEIERLRAELAAVENSKP